MVLWCEFFSGWISGMAGLIVGHPMDTVKVRQQIHARPLWETIKATHSQTGLLAFFRGMGLPLLTNGVINSVYFGVYGGSLNALLCRRWEQEEASQKGKSGYSRKHEASYGEHFVAGCVGGLAQLGVSCPVDLVKVQLQNRLHKSMVKGPLDCIVQIVKSHGVKGLYRGVSPQFFRDVPASGGYFVIYQYCRKLFSAVDNEPSKLALFFAGGFAGMLSWWSILPLDVIKSRMQGEAPGKNQYKGMLHCGRLIVRHEGVKGLFKGFLPLTIRAFPTNGATFLVYEYLNPLCSKYHLDTS